MRFLAMVTAPLLLLGTWSFSDSLIVTQDSVVYEGGTYDRVDLGGHRLVTLRKVRVFNAVGSNDYAGIFSNGKYVDIDSCEVDGNASATRGRGTCGAIKLDGATRVTIRDCNLHNCNDDALRIFMSHFVTIRGNRCYRLLGCGTDNGCSSCNNGHSDGLQAMGCFNMVVRENLFYDIVSTSAMQFQADDARNYCRNLEVSNNLCYIPSVGLPVYFYETDSINCYNNVIWGSDQGGYGGLSIQGNTVTKLHMYNNIIFSVNLNHLGGTYNAAQHHTDYNLYGKNNNQGNWPISAHDIVNPNPGFAGLPAVGGATKTNVTAADFALNASSPAVNKGCSVAGVPALDFYGNGRNGAPDIGGIEYQGTNARARVWFTATNREGAGPLTVAFHNTAPPAYTSWQWQFGDGTTGTQVNPSHVYTNPGRYNVTLVGSGSGFADTLTVRCYVVVTSGSALRDPARVNGLEPAVTLAPHPMTRSVGFQVTGAEPECISIFDHRGKPVRTLVNSDTWDGRSDNGRVMGPGLYLYRVAGSGFTVGGKLVKIQ